MTQSSHEITVTEQILGTGAFGTIFKGFLNKRPVAIKKIHLVDKSIQYEPVILNGIKIQIALKHDNIVRAFIGQVDRKTSSTDICVVLEYMEKGALSQLIFNSHLLLTDEMRISFMKDVVNALDYMHQHNIIHRDIKSENVLLDENRRAKLADFDMAVELDSLGNYTSHKRAGTPNRFAPELISPNIPEQYQYTIKVELYALGKLLYELITRKVPFNWADTDEEMYQYVLKRKCEPISPKTLKELSDIYTSCMSYEPINRPSTQKILAMLSAAQESLTLHRDNDVDSDDSHDKSTNQSLQNRASSAQTTSPMPPPEYFEEQDRAGYRAGCCMS